MKPRLLKACAVCGAILLLFEVFAWVRSRYYLDSVSFWGPVRVEVWNQEGKIGLYVSNYTPSMRTQTFTWGAQSLSEPYWGRPVRWAIVVDENIPQSGFINPEPEPLIPRFEFRLINGKYPELEIPHWFVFFSLTGLEGLCVYFLIRARRRARLTASTKSAALDTTQDSLAGSLSQ